jgi:hypothetical protein
VCLEPGGAFTLAGPLFRSLIVMRFVFRDGGLRVLCSFPGNIRMLFCRWKWPCVAHTTSEYPSRNNDR